jgi:hypothetical protein
LSQVAVAEVDKTLVSVVVEVAALVDCWKAQSLFRKTLRIRSLSVLAVSVVAQLTTAEHPGQRPRF